MRPMTYSAAVYRGIERLMKRIAIGRKNWLFTGSLRAGIRNASLMSLVASASRIELDVSMYLESVDVLSHNLSIPSPHPPQRKILPRYLIP